MKEICRTCNNFYFVCSNCTEKLKLPTVSPSSPVGSVDTKSEVCIRCGFGGRLRLVSQEDYHETAGRPRGRRTHSCRRI